MYGYNEGKQQLLHIIEEVIKQLEMYLPESTQIEKLTWLHADIQADFHMIVVLGEFKRGKSTFVNALLGEELLPVDVTPTTATINAVFHGSERKLSIYHENGTVEESELSFEALNRYSVDGSEDANEVKFVKMQLPFPMLGERGVIVDTPGVNDMNRQRMDVTFQYIPRADAVLFLLDATAPVKRSEAEFISDTFEKNGLDRIVFIANFYDQVDEEDQDDLLRQIETRLKPVLKGTTPYVIPFSAREALTARLTEDNYAIETSGFHHVSKVVQDLIERGKQSDGKLLRYKQRMQACLATIRMELDQVLTLSRQGIDEITTYMEGLQSVKQKHETIRRQMVAYVEDRQVEIKTIVHKSFSHFELNLKEDLHYMIMSYHGNGMKELVENQIPLLLKKKINQWIEQYMPAVDKLLQMLERELAVGLATEFNANIARLAVKKSGGSINIDAELSITSENLLSTQVKAGIIAGSVGVIASLMGGFVLLPFVSLAGFPVLQNMMMKKQLDQAREKLLPELDEALRQVGLSFRVELDNQLDQLTKDVQDAALMRYEELIEFIYAQLEREVQERQDISNNLENEKYRFEEMLVKLENWVRQVEAIHIIERIGD
ncbi:GTPase Era involved in 16S rRNA processing [Paenibacillus amylolyticus]|uniref:GTPase Era involved in 16S rRNA processing n=1 Tax=Paenibacillus amylolyticus TaxID=1451 RepID=A0AAP5H4H3_PAEAM|nr:dynamin family protein [Paenibacillus amylolyticus]MDR6726188.1 GTPase Era involved in 16S rRNA processing [Paenibacillus amylolyticus]